MKQQIRTQVPSEAYFAEIERLIAANQLQAAAHKLNAIAHAAQADPRLHMLGMRLAEAAGNPEAALQSARRAISRAPDWAPTRLNLGLLLARLNQFPEALSEADRAVALAPSAILILYGAIDIAQRAGDDMRSIIWLETALKLDPSNTDCRLRLAASLSMTASHSRALDILDKLVAETPSNSAAREMRALARANAGDVASALEDWDFLLEKSPTNSIWQYRREVASGGAPERMPPALVSELYDKIADVYDTRQLKEARYRLPMDVADRILQLRPDRKFNLLDLGCGTGLLGLMLQRVEGALVGVDLSLKMIEKAAAHTVYAKFHHVDLLEALEATPASLYEVITALDALNYIGDLQTAIINAARILVPGGHLFFSCELLAEDAAADWALLDNGHYAQKSSRIKALCTEAGLKPVVVSELTLRQDGRRAVRGFLVEACKPQRKKRAARTRTKATERKVEAAAQDDS